MIAASELFKGLNDASADGRLPHLKDGKYVLEVLSTKRVNGYQSGVSFVVEARVAESAHPDFPAGREVSATINRLTDPKSENRALALGNLKAFLAGALSNKFGEEVDPNSAQNWEEVAQICIAQEDYLKGCKVSVQVDTIETKSGRPFAKHTWRSVAA